MKTANVIPVSNFKKKWVECDDCAWVGQLVAWIPLKLSCCKGCGSLKIRLYKHTKNGKLK